MTGYVAQQRRLGRGTYDPATDAVIASQEDSFEVGLAEPPTLHQQIEQGIIGGSVKKPLLAWGEPLA